MKKSGCGKKMVCYLVKYVVIQFTRNTKHLFFIFFIENQLLSSLFYQKTKSQIKIKSTLTKSIFFLLMLQIKSRVLGIVTKFSSTKLQPQPKQCYIIPQMLVDTGNIKIQIWHVQEKIENTVNEMLGNISFPHGPSSWSIQKVSLQS